MFTVPFIAKVMMMSSVVLAGVMFGYMAIRCLCLNFNFTPRRYFENLFERVMSFLAFSCFSAAAVYAVVEMIRIL